mmetsp:Transcript_7050/g.18221  ORF Transcript_7050/g.18221 Transcript_7050/m.18221 type:complete len:133 (+) Transcript_7050:882-1280(+)
MLSSTSSEESGLLSQDVYEGDVNVTVRISAHGITSDGYQAKLRVFLAVENATLAEDPATRDLTRLEYSIHSSIATTWWTLYSQEATSGAYHNSDGQLVMAAMSIRREGGVIKAAYTLDPDGGVWEEVSKAAK